MERAGFCVLNMGKQEWGPAVEARDLTGLEPGLSVLEMRPVSSGGLRWNVTGDSLGGCLKIKTYLGACCLVFTDMHIFGKMHSCLRALVDLGVSSLLRL